METKIITDDLRLLGVGRQYVGYNLVIRAVRMVLCDEKKLLCIKSGVYVPLADLENCDWRAVERNIRTVIQRAWNVKPGQVQAMMGYAMDRPPTLTEFLDMMVEYIINLPSYQKRNGDRRSRRTPHMYFNRKG